MSKTNSMFEQVPVSVPKISAHDLSHEHLTSMQVGALYPTLCMEVMPDSTVSLGNLTNVSLPPFASKFNGKIDLKTEAFFVPMRLLWGGWKNFISQKNQTVWNGTVPANVPTVCFQTSNPMGKTYPGTSTNDFAFNRTFLEQLGYNPAATDTTMYSLLPLIAYHKIWDDWYRDARLQIPAFSETNAISTSEVDGSGNTPYRSTCWRLPWTTNSVNMNVTKLSFNTAMTSITSHIDWCLADRYPIFCPRPRLYGKDYFTVAIPTATEQGTKKSVSVSGNAFTIDALRTANIMQKYAEKLARVGDRYEDIIASTYGVRPSDAVLQRPLLLGSSSKPLYTQGVKATWDPQTDMSYNVPDVTSKYGLTANAETGRIESADALSICNNFTTTEAGYIIVLQSIVPHAYYKGIKLKDTMHKVFTDFGNPAFATLGNVAIQSDEVVPNSTGVFGYGQRYSEYKFRNDRVTGEMQRTLSSFALFRDLSGSQSIGSDFLEIHPNCMNGVLSYSVPTAEDLLHAYEWNGSVWSRSTTNVLTVPWCTNATAEFECDSYYNCTVVNPLPVYSIPSLEGLSGETRMVPNGGTRIS